MSKKELCLILYVYIVNVEKKQQHCTRDAYTNKQTNNDVLKTFSCGHCEGII